MNYLGIVSSFMFTLGPSLGRDDKPSIGHLFIRNLHDLTEVLDVGVALLQCVLQLLKDGGELGLLMGRNVCWNGQIVDPCRELEAWILHIELCKHRCLTVSGLEGSSILVNLALNYDSGVVIPKPLFIHF